jgi:transcriptional regulator with XRE-family HTH domain
LPCARETHAILLLLIKRKRVPTKLEDQITKRVIAARQRGGLDRKDVADALNMGLNSYGHYERGRYAFTVDQLFTLSRVLGVRVEWLLGLESDLAEDEERLLGAYRSMGEERRRLTLEYVEFMARAERE